MLLYEGHHLLSYPQAILFTKSPLPDTVTQLENSAHIPTSALHHRYSSPPKINKSKVSSRTKPKNQTRSTSPSPQSCNNSPQARPQPPMVNAKWTANASASTANSASSSSTYSSTR
ncbi:hypothetical protein J1614_003897 [Plenodomus biglobosus]|nr:hypothetical protein J1614_003897 [Plenodomus biglobosus]